MKKVEPCIACGDPEGSRRIRNGNEWIIRIKGMCKKCSNKNYHLAAKKRVAANPRSGKPRLFESSPCLGCKTKRGAIDGRSGNPARFDGYCARCHDTRKRLRRKGVSQEEALKANPCMDCGTEGGLAYKSGRPMRTLNRCHDCYNKFRVVERRKIRQSHAKPKREPRPIKPCLVCGTDEGTIDRRNGRFERLKGLCRSCYQSWVKKGLKFENLSGRSVKPPPVKVIEQRQFEIRRKALAQLLIPDPIVETCKPMTESQKRERSERWVREVLAAERSLSAWVVKRDRAEADRATQELSGPPALLAS